MHSQTICESGEGEKFEYEKLTTLCEQYGGQTPTITIADGFSSDYPAGNWNNEIVQISGEFTINTADFDILNTVIEMGAGAGITVEVGARLDIRDSYIFSCTEMWRSIRAKNLSDLRVVRSTIEDAQYAIDATSADVVLTNGVTFQSNWVAVRLTQKPPNPTAVHRFINSIFSGNSLRPAYPGQVPAPGTESYAGMLADTIPMVELGNTNPNVSNRFIGLNNGVISERSNFAIRRTSFEGMIDEDDLYGLQSGVGILALENSFIDHVGFGETGPPAFVSCQYAGIHTIESTCTTRRALHSRLGKYGIYAILPKANYTDVQSSRFENSIVDIYTAVAVNVERSTTNDDKIIDNYFYSTVLGGTMIAFKDMGAGSGEALILDNTIESTLRRVFSGIEVRPGGGIDLLVSDNIITADSMTVGLNINFSNNTATDKVVTNNRVEFLQWGNELARLEFARDILYCDNTFIGNGVTLFGLRVLSNASGTTLGLNKIEAASRGMFFQGTGINMGDQVHRGNTWDGGFGTWAAEHTGLDFSFSRFFVNDDPTNCGVPNYFPNDLGVPSVFPNSGWFIDENISCIDDCSQPQSNLTLGNVYEKIATGEGLTMGWTPAAHWVAQAYLHKELEDNAATGLSPALRNSFDGQLGANHIVEVQNYKTRIQIALGGSATTRANTRTQYSAYAEALTNYIIYLESLDELEVATPEHLASQQWAEAYTAFDAYVMERSIERNNALEHLIEELNLSNPNLIEENWLMVSRLSLERERYGELSTADWAILEELASQCYDEHGPAVYMAQGMLAPCQREAVRERSAQACENMERPALPKAELDQTQEPLFSVYPNPGNGLLQLQYDAEVETSDYIIVKNIYGQEVLQQVATLPEIDLRSTLSGLYFLEYRDKDGVLLSTAKYMHL